MADRRKRNETESEIEKNEQKMRKKRRDPKNVYKWQTEERLNETVKEREKKIKEEGKEKERGTKNVYD